MVTNDYAINSRCAVQAVRLVIYQVQRTCKKYAWHVYCGVLSGNRRRGFVCFHFCRVFSKKLFCVPLLRAVAAAAALPVAVHNVQNQQQYASGTKYQVPGKQYEYFVLGTYAKRSAANHCTSPPRLLAFGLIALRTKYR